VVAAQREELSAANAKIKNLKSQLARARNADESRVAAFNADIVAAESRADEFRKEILRRERCRVDDRDLRRAMQSFDEIWKAMNLEEQRNLLGQLIEKVGYDDRTGKVTVSFKSASVKKLCQK
jgi:hypothetical protein